MKNTLYLAGLLLAVASGAWAGVETIPTHGRNIYRRRGAAGTRILRDRAENHL